MFQLEKPQKSGPLLTSMTESSNIHSCKGSTGPAKAILAGIEHHLDICGGGVGAQGRGLKLTNGSWVSVCLSVSIQFTPLFIKSLFINAAIPMGAPSAPSKTRKTVTFQFFHFFCKLMNSFD
jgi:hypothetical protein